MFLATNIPWFFALFLFLFNYQSPVKTPAVSESEQSCIDHMISIDAQAGKIRNRACEKQSLTKTIEEYVATIDAVDLSNCPREFAAAFKRHIQAWRAMIPLCDPHASLRGEMHDLFKQIEQGAGGAAFKKGLDKVWSTWSEVEKAMGK